MTATLYTTIKGNPRNPPNNLIRYNFLEILVRIAIDKYFKTGICDYVKDAIELFVNKHLYGTDLK